MSRPVTIWIIRQICLQVNSSQISGPIPRTSFYPTPLRRKLRPTTPLSRSRKRPMLLLIHPNRRFRRLNS